MDELDLTAVVFLASALASRPDQTQKLLTTAKGLHEKEPAVLDAISAIEEALPSGLSSITRKQLETAADQLRERGKKQHIEVSRIVGDALKSSLVG